MKGNIVLPCSPCVEPWARVEGHEGTTRWTQGLAFYGTAFWAQTHGRPPTVMAAGACSASCAQARPSGNPSNRHRIHGGRCPGRAGRRRRWGQYHRRAELSSSAHISATRNSKGSTTEMPFFAPPTNRIDAIVPAQIETSLLSKPISRSFSRGMSGREPHTSQSVRRMVHRGCMNIRAAWNRHCALMPLLVYSLQAEDLADGMDLLRT